MLSNCKGNVVNRMNLEQYKGVFIYAQQVDNKIDAIALELLGKANDLAADLGTDVTAVLIGSDVKGLVDELAEYGADKVIVVDDPELKEYRTEPYTHALASVINEYKPDILLVGATAIGRDLGPRVSARVATGLTADCTVLEIGEFKARGDKEPRQGQLLMTRPAFVVTQSLQSLVLTIVHRWLQFVLVLCRRKSLLQVQRQKLLSTIQDLLQMTNMLRFLTL